MVNTPSAPTMYFSAFVSEERGYEVPAAPLHSEHNQLLRLSGSVDNGAISPP